MALAVVGEGARHGRRTTTGAWKYEEKERVLRVTRENFRWRTPDATVIMLRVRQRNEHLGEYSACLTCIVVHVRRRLYHNAVFQRDVHVVVVRKSRGRRRPRGVGRDDRGGGTGVSHLDVFHFERDHHHPFDGGRLVTAAATVVAAAVATTAAVFVARHRRVFRQSRRHARFAATTSIPTYGDGDDEGDNIGRWAISLALVVFHCGHNDNNKRYAQDGNRTGRDDGDDEDGVEQ